MAREFDEIYPPPSQAEPLLKYLTRFEPAFLASQLVACGAISLQRNGKTSVTHDPEVEVHERDFVFKRSPVPPPCDKALRDTPADAFRDIACVPRAGGSFTTLWQSLFEVRRHPGEPGPPEKMTTLLSAMDSLEDFVARLRSAATHPVRDFLLSAHGWASGWLDIPVRAGAKATMYEDLVASTSSKLKLPENLLTPPLKSTTGGSSRAFHIRGCRIGIAEPFLQALKAALGGKVVVTAPKHWSYVSRFPQPFGYFEYMKYSFGFYRAKPFSNKGEAIKEFNGRGFSWIDGTPIAPARWAAWIPDDLEAHRRPLMANIRIPVGGNTFEIETEFTHRPYEYFDGEIPIDAIGADPGTPKARRAAFASYLANRYPHYREGHPFPEWRRLELPSLDDLLKTFDVQLVWSQDRVKVTGSAHWYEVKPPVVSMNTQVLFMNYYPTVASAQPVETLDVNDGRLFVRV